jgi:hypothetical protein
VVGVVIASMGEVQFVMVGFLFQVAGIVFEAIRLVMVERLLSSSEFKMDPLVSLYYYAPACAVMNGMVLIFTELPVITMEDIYRVGGVTLFANALVAFMLNVSVVFLIGKTSSLVLTLSGVLKDILLVFASMFLFRDPVSLLQGFGYSIALCGLVYYKLGGDTIKDYLGHGGMKWQEFGQRRPALRKVIVFAAAIVSIFMIVGSLGPRYAPDSTQKMTSGFGRIIGEKGV